MVNITITPEIKIDWVPRKIQRGKQTALKISLTIPHGIHIQTHKPAEDLLIASKIALENVEGISFGKPIYPDPKKLPTSWSPVTLLVYEGEIDIFIPIMVAKDAKSGKYVIRGILSFQGCTDTLCLPPKEQKFTLKLEIL